MSSGKPAADPRANETLDRRLSATLDQMADFVDEVRSRLLAVEGLPAQRIGGRGAVTRAVLALERLVPAHRTLLVRLQDCEQHRRGLDGAKIAAEAELTAALVEAQAALAGLSKGEETDTGSRSFSLIEAEARDAQLSPRLLALRKRVLAANAQADLAAGDSISSEAVKANSPASRRSRRSPGL